MDLPAGEHYATKEIQELCDQVKTKVEEITGRNLVEFEAFIYSEFKSLHFANYQVKVCVGETEYFHVLFHRTISDQGEVKTTVDKVEQHHTKDDIIVPVNSQ